MPFRARFKKAFGRSSSSSSSSSSTTPSGLPIEFYKPGEVPRSKYRGPWNQEHQDKLSAFTFSFGRRNSYQGSDCSPAQSRAHSRRSSWISHRRPSTKGSASARSIKASERASSRIGQVEEIEGDDDITNVGMSRRQTRERRGADFASRLDDEVDGEGTELAQALTVTLPPIVHENDRPFTEEELTKALTEVTLRPPRSAGVA